MEQETKRETRTRKESYKMINSRSKGIRGERAIIDALQPIVDTVYASLALDAPLLQRNTLQSDRGGYDVIGLEWLAIEVKNCATLALETWWTQCERQARGDQTPVLFYKATRGKWRVRMLTTLYCGNQPLPGVLVDIAFEAFLEWFPRRLKIEIANTFGSHPALDGLPAVPRGTITKPGRNNSGNLTAPPAPISEGILAGKAVEWCNANGWVVPRKGSKDWRAMLEHYKATISA